MEMKAEYSFGSYKVTDIRLLRQNLGNTPARVLHVLRKLYPESSLSNQPLEDFIRGKPDDVIFSCRLSHQTDINFLREQFLWANAQPEICETDIALINANEPVLNYRLDGKDSFLGGGARLPSEDLSRMQEYRFDSWAKENHLSEAYRSFLFPGLGQAEVIRVWHSGENAYGIYKLGDEGFCIKAPAKEIRFELEAEVWQKFSAFMKQFWQAASWETQLEDIYTDGFSLEFEGWRKGEYKNLHDGLPYMPDSISIKAHKLFRALVPF